ncbi:alkylhydroperoxidase AhpD family core domain-containing protein [Chryseobacterium indoltheticum]|uniref:Alkylhydroperoxidase AhpD family core domain-containing protein n=2 Tax=Chryseobacterium indoltheticum TaxID=254 RepID=A0A381F9Z1_9FLAO|nr:carboxymuconolactone decarboxylase family protein [Chryseobacterium indoltheticum]SIR00231.1 alkylhydroperoxidase AhpD family core domain-containing protein [Chryseobacterium indoltheticum]SUX43400.1 Arsenate reductase and related proteins, glutaredoxin family [Chryseobacterium indoltheticum]
MNKLMLFTLIFMALSITTKAQNDMSEKNKTEKKNIVNQSFGKIDFKKKLYAENVTNYLDLPTQIAKKYGSFSYADLPLDRQIAEQVRLWASIRYKCSYCTIFHTNDARNTGMDTHKVDNIMAYNQSDLFSAKEKAALNYASAISYVDYEKLPAATAEVNKYFNEAEIETIIMCTLLMDIWARIFAVQGNTPYYTQ